MINEVIEQYRYLKFKKILTLNKLELLAKELATETDRDKAIKIDIEIHYQRFFLNKVEDLIHNLGTEIYRYAHLYNEEELEVFVMLKVLKQPKKRIMEVLGITHTEIKKYEQYFNEEIETK